MVKLTETVVGSAQGCLIGGRMRNEDVIALAKALDSAGFRALEVLNSDLFRICMERLAENPWQRIKTVKQALSATPLMVHLDGLCGFGKQLQPDEVIEKTVQQVAKAGADLFRIGDSLNDPRNLEVAVKAAMAAGKQVEAVIELTEKLVNAPDEAAKLAKQYEEMGCNSLCLSDGSAFLTPVLATALVQALKKAVKLPMALTVSDAGQTAGLVYQAAISAGIDFLDTALSPFSRGEAAPATEALVVSADSTIKLAALDAALVLARKLRALHDGDTDAGCSRVGSRILKHHLPSYLVRQLAEKPEVGDDSGLEQILAEVATIRNDLGGVALSGAAAMAIAEQAVLNRSAAKRYAKLADDFSALTLGCWGALPGSLASDLKQALPEGKTEHTERAGEAIEPVLGELGKSFSSLVKGEEESLLLAFYKKAAEALLSGKAKAEQPGQSKVRAYDVNVGGQNYHVEVNPSQPGGASIVPVAAKTEKAAAARPAPASSGRPAPTRPAPAGSGTRPAPAGPPNRPRAAAPARPAAPSRPAPVAAAPAAPAAPTPPAAAPAASAGGGNGAGVQVTCPMQGSILNILVKPGDVVERGQKICIVEAMKMENDVLTHVSGTVKSILVSAGQAVQADEALIVVET